MPTPKADPAFKPLKSQPFSGPLSTRTRKAKLIEALFRNEGRVRRSCALVNVDRSIYADWLKNDPAFAEQVKSVEQSVDDWYEDAFKSLVKEGNPQAVIHAAKTRLRGRGYGEKLEVDAHVTGSGAFIGALAMLEGGGAPAEPQAVETEAEVVDDSGEVQKRRARAPRRLKRGGAK